MRALQSKSLCLMLVSVFSLIFSLGIFSFRKQIVDKILHSQLTIKEGTAAYDAFLETPVPVLTKFYFFDMLNPRDLFHSHEKPILEERGPYTFREVQRKVNLNWHPNGTVSFHRQKFWYFQRDLSVGPLTDMVTTINVPVVGSAEFVRGSFLMEWGISDMLSTIEAEIFVKKTIKELLFDGYEDTVMLLGSSFRDSSEEDYDYYETDSEDDNEDKATENVIHDKFGWFYKRNGTTWSDGDIEMRTGEEDIERLGEIVSWNNESRTEAYEGECGRVRGSSEGLFPPGVADITDSLSFYSTDLCRPLHFTKSGLSSVHGIPVTTFDLDPTNFANSTNCPSNVCYNNNLPTGVQNVTLCKAKSPVFVSRPHFYLADQSYREQFQYGLKPDPSRHDSVFWLEPMSSIPLKVDIRLQLNILLRKVEGIEYLFKNLPEIMFPVFWFESLSEISEEMSGPINMLIMLPTMIKFCSLISFITSLLIIISVISCQISDHRKERILLKEVKTQMTIVTTNNDYQYCQVPKYE